VMTIAVITRGEEVSSGLLKRTTARESSGRMAEK